MKKTKPKRFTNEFKAKVINEMNILKEKEVEEHLLRNMV